MSKAIKRKRTDASDTNIKKQKSRKAARLGPIVKGDALKWKEVALPDRLDDAEGFYGLEEIDDVEILKDENGQITFRPSTDDDVIVGEGEVAGEEWGGFDDEGTDDQSSVKDTHTAINAQQTAHNNGVSKGSEVQKSRKENGPSKEKKATKATKPKTVHTTSEPLDVEDEIDFNTLGEMDEQEQADITAWKELDLSPEMLSAISRLGFSDPTPIQKATIPSIREGLDVIGKAVTGSGKTLAFGIPVIEKWLESNSNMTGTATKIPIAFILAPTRELAHQLSKHLVALARGLDQVPRIATVTGGLALVKQQRQLEHADIIIGTPGRLWEVINSSHGLIDRLKQIQFLIIDEADRLLSEGHFKEVEEILDVLNRKVTDDTEDGEEKLVQTSQPQVQRQTLVFSATFHKGLQQKLASKQKWRPNESNLLTNTQSLDYLLQKLHFQKGIKPTFVDANPTSSMAENLSESILECGAMQKDLYLYSLLLKHQHDHTKHLRSNPTTTDRTTRTLIFTNSISTVKRLVQLLTTLSISSTQILPLHSSMPQKSRLRSLERFTTPPNQSDTTAILIATDVAARGLDIKGVHTIIHYHVPRTADMYVHRSGRTARASTSGASILICSPDEVAGVTRLISKIHSASNSNNDSPNNNNKSRKSTRGLIAPLTLSPSLIAQLTPRVKLAQRITETTSATSASRSEDSWLRAAAADLGVDYSSEEFEGNSKRGRRGRGGDRERKKRDAVGVVERGEVGRWRGELRAMLGSRVDFGDLGGAGRFLAGGAVDVEGLLRDRDRDRERDRDRDG